MVTDYFNLPDLLTLEECAGNFYFYYESVYEIFKNDFIINKPKFRGQRIGLKKYPLVDGKEYTFYHLTHFGKNEKDRLPDLQRMERIRWPKPLISSSDHPYLKVWQNHRGPNKRILIYHEYEGYLVVLDDRGEYLLPWTAYLVTEQHRKRKLLIEYETFISANAAQ